MVAVGSLHKVWVAVPEDLTPAGLQDAFRNRFGAEWSEVLQAAERSFSYNAANDAYLAVRSLKPVTGLTLEKLLETKGAGRVINVVVS